ncbi:hypothetical protein HAX54_051848, partial [Datura stramonium]|nr:hypothetical protein [Datura stramonium]
MANQRSSKAREIVTPDDATTRRPPLTFGTFLPPQLQSIVDSSEAFSKAASAIGKSMHTDECTAYMKRISYAYVLIEVDVAQDLPESILGHIAAECWENDQEKPDAQ